MGLQVVEAHPLFPYFLEKCLAIPTSLFFHLLVNGFSVIIIIIIIINFFRRSFLLAIGPFGFSFSVWTKVRPCWLNN